MTHSATPPAAQPAPRGGLSWLQDTGLLGVILLLGAVLTIYGYYDALPGRPNTFMNRDNLVDGIATPMSYYAIMAVGMTCVVVAGGIDISVASIFALAAFVTAYVLQQFPRDTAAFVLVPVSVGLPVLIGLVCGLINGALVVGLRLHPFIVTLGTLSIFRGVCNVLPFGTKTLPTAGQPLPDWSVTHLFKHRIADMQLWPLAATLIVLAAGVVYLRLSIAGRETYAVGGNEEAARFSGINVGFVKLRVYAISGMLGGLAGLVSLGKYGSVSTNSGTGYELTVVAATVVGGASLSGGRGTAVGALLGALILSLIDNAINILHLNQEYKNIIVGLSILIAVSLDRLSEAWRTWRATRRV